MTKFWKGLIATMAGAVFAGIVYAVGIANPVVNQPALAYSHRYVIDLQNAAVNTITATAVYSSATLASGTFSSGQVSTGSFTIADNTKLAAATATNQITVTSTSGALGDSVVVTKLNKPGAYICMAGRDWNYKTTVALTADSLKTCLAKIPDFATSRSGAILYSTATSAGSTYNAIGVTTNNTDTLTIAHATFTGGRDAAVITVNGYAFKAGVGFAIGAAASNSATNLANAINAKTTLLDQVVATPSSADVTLQSVKPGALWNFTLKTSNTAAVTVLHPTMVGGITAGWTLGGKNIAVAGHGFSLALPLLFSGSNTYKIDPLVNQTTYYAIPVDANTLQLADSSAHALSGTALVWTSSQTLTSAVTYTLAPLAFTSAATTGGKWQVSNDNSSWSDVSASSFSWVGGGGAGSTNWNLGLIPYRYLGFNVVGPATGGLNLNVTAFGTYSTP